jgi:hypothetical protein
LARGGDEQKAINRLPHVQILRNENQAGTLAADKKLTKMTGHRVDVVSYHNAILAGGGAKNLQIG